MARTAAWDAELYEARHSFVFKFGEDLLKLLDAKAGERILDLGCGPGQLTAKIAEAGADVLGLYSSPEMIGQARQNYPNLTFVLEDATRLKFNGEFDAVFSNAALHWMLDAAGVARGVSDALRPGGRFVAELGGRRNIFHIESALKHVVAEYVGDALPPSRTFYPSIAEYGGILEAHHLEVRSAVLFDRPTLLEGAAGMENWIRQFKWYYIEALPAPQRDEALRRVVEELRPVLFRDGKWYADYRRLRITASKV
jgi:trans-aconitate methyltransferase